MDFTKDFSSYESSCPVTGGSEPVRQGIDQFFITMPDHISEFGKIARVACRQSFTPGFSFTKYLLFHPVAAPEPVDCRLDRIRVHVPHDLADKLFLPAQRAMSGNGLGCNHGIQQRLGKSDTVQLVDRQVDELFTERLQGQEFALSGRFTGL